MTTEPTHSIPPDHSPVDEPSALDRFKKKQPLLRRLSSRIGLQGKLLLAFVALVTAALGTSCWLYVNDTNRRLEDLLANEARQTASTLSIAGAQAWGDDAALKLGRLGDDLVHSRNIVYVVFHDADGKPTIVRSRETGFEGFALHTFETADLMRVHPRRINSGEPLLEVTWPVICHAARGDSVARGRGVMGYVSVGVSRSRVETELTRVQYWVVGVGGVLVLLSLPVAYVLVHRIFLPIRQLVTATKRLAAGDLDCRVASDRSDLIGTLARAFNDMTKQVKNQQDALTYANARLADGYRDLETKVDQRTLQLETANKRLSNEIAEKEDFLRAVSHDLNAPLRNISGMVTMLLLKKKDMFDEDVVNRLERIRKNVEVETDLITELLELSRIKTRRQEMEMVEIEGMVWELRGMFENDLKTRGIDLVVDSALPNLNCERARVRQVFQNLIDNAIKYMGEGAKREIHVGCTLRLSEAEFYVRDTGLGIDAEDVGKVFHIFRRGKHAANAAIAGKGVGLASVKSIVETYSGKIWVESQVGKGSCFRFTINGQYVPTAGGYVRPMDEKHKLAMAG